MTPSNRIIATSGFSGEKFLVTDVEDDSDDKPVYVYDTMTDSSKEMLYHQAVRFMDWIPLDPPIEVPVEWEI